LALHIFSHSLDQTRWPCNPYSRGEGLWSMLTRLSNSGRLLFCFWPISWLDSA
jgi:hypothetical protein